MTTSDDDKTRIQLRKQDTQGGDATVIASARETNISLEEKNTEDDKTRVAPNVAKESEKDKVKLAKARVRHLEEKLRRQQRTNTKQNESDLEPQIDSGDRTRFDKTITREASLAENVDKTRFAPPKNRAIRATPTASVTENTPLENTESSNSEGMLKNRFVLESVLGAGGMGMVYKAKDLLKVEAQDREPYVAVKVLGEEFKAHPEAFIALQRESRKSQRIAHPNIVNVHDFDRDGDMVFMTMELLEGSALDKLISQYRSIGLPRDDVWQILKGICSALTHAHNEKIIHSDFKPGNIFFTDKGIAKVFDFGIARAVAKAEHIEDSVDDKTVFDAGNLGALTPAYASLEMLEGLVPDVRDDIYALGCIAYELFTGEHPYNRVNASEAAKQKLKPKRIPGLTKRQWRAVESAIAFQRRDRIATVDEFWQLLSTKKATSVWFAAASVLFVMALAAGAYFQFGLNPESDFKEDEVRGEIESRLRLELQTKAINKLITSMYFTEIWERDLWQQIQSARVLMGVDDVWLVDIEKQIYTAYLEKINEAITTNDYIKAERFLTNGLRYAQDTDALGALKTQLNDLIAQEKRAAEAIEKQKLLTQQKKQAKAQQAAEIAEQRSAYEAALNSVNEQLSCRSNIDMKDLGIAITKLRSLNMAKYLKEEPRFVNSLAACLEKIGRNFPERAKDSKKAAMRIFESNATIEAISIIPKDPCSKSIAGLGARGSRAICRDRIARVGQGPSMVVVPAPEKGRIFAIGKYEVSVDDINTFCEATGKCSKLLENDVKLPATNISSSTVSSYLKWLSVETKYVYRLPTHEEWLYAAKAGKNKLDSNRNCTLSSRGIEKGGSLLKASVGRQNAWGLVNHIGNAQEWVNKKGGGYSVVGGSHSTPMDSCDFDYERNHSGEKDDLTGFRVLREILEQKN